MKSSGAVQWYSPYFPLYLIFWKFSLVLSRWPFKKADFSKNKKIFQFSKIFPRITQILPFFKKQLILCFWNYKITLDCRSKVVNLRPGLVQLKFEPVMPNFISIRFFKDVLKKIWSLLFTHFKLSSFKKWRNIGEIFAEYWRKTVRPT